MCKLRCCIPCLLLLQAAFSSRFQGRAGRAGGRVQRRASADAVPDVAGALTWRQALRPCPPVQALACAKNYGCADGALWSHASCAADGSIPPSDDSQDLSSKNYQGHLHSSPCPQRGATAQETPPQHFTTPRGDFHGGKPPFRCRPIGNGSFSVTRDHALEVVPGSSVEPDVAEWVLQHGWRNSGAQEAGLCTCLQLRDVSCCASHTRAGVECVSSAVLRGGPNAQSSVNDTVQPHC